MFNQIWKTATICGCLLLRLCIGANAQDTMNFQTDVYVQQTAGYHTYRIPALVVTAQNTVLCFAEGRKNSASDSGDIDLLIKRSSDGGKTWSQQTIVHEEGGDAPITIGNPCPIVDKDNVIHLLLTRNNKELLYTRSSADGLTWAPPAEITNTLRSFNFDTRSFNFDTKRIGTGPIHGIQNRTGRLLVPVWLCDGLANTRNRTYRSGVIYSDDKGATWNAGGLVPPSFTQLNECALIERADGSLLLNMRGAGQGARSISISNDGGLSWSEPILEKQLPCPVCQAGVLRLPDGDVLFSNPAGTQDAPGKGRINMTIRLSSDEGKTWPVARSLHAGPAGYSDLTVLKDGTILCVYENGDKTYHQKISIAGFTRAWLMR